jgi:hypothetical protein
MNIAPLLTSVNSHYCTPPEIVVPMRRLLVPRGAGRRLLDPASNGASIVGAHMTCDGLASDGLSVRWSDADCWYSNPPYGTEIAAHVERQAYWGREIGIPGISLLPARVDTRWCTKHIFGTADAWLYVAGRLTFWIPVPLDIKDAPVPAKGGEPYYLRRWFPGATDDDLPAPFRCLEPGFAVGPELGSNGKPQAAPFPSLVAFWADPNAAEVDPRDELEVLRKLVADAIPYSVIRQDWFDAAELLTANKPTPEQATAALARITAATGLQTEHPIDVREFSRRFGRLGTLTVARGPHRGVYRP